ncbi:MAG: REP-associated tyrosine transposase [Arenimonas sp.]
MRTGDDTPGYRALRQGRASLDGQVYFVTFVTCRRRRIFLKASRAEAAVRALLDPRLWRRSRLLAWVLMPDHWHGLVELGDGERLDAVIRRAKANSSRSLRRAEPSLGAVWCEGFQDRALRCEDNLVAAARYLVLNPFRAGLVRRIADYPWWGAIWVVGRASGLTPLPQGQVAASPTLVGRA